jgi:flavin reductase (DIM6/NTAB) family NADH-FMN oxidoreductase RutF
MAKREVDYRKVLEETVRMLGDMGLLLAAQDAKGKPNAMAIGWATPGIIWGKPIFVVYVRPSRYTYKLIEQTNAFTVCVPDAQLKKAVAFCGSVSGRDHDKFAEMKLTAVPAKHVPAPLIEECPISFECAVVHKNDVVPKALTEEIRSGAYPGGDFHRCYFGEILACYTK